MTISEMLTSWMKKEFERDFPGSDLNLSAIDVVPTQNPDFGDYQCNAAMAVAKQLKKNPRQLAQELTDKAVLHESVAKIEIAGPGFINLFLKNEWLVKYIQDQYADRYLAVTQTGTGKNVVVDYSSPNVAKPMHIGHIRSTIIGNSIDRLYRSMGYNVIADNHIGDWGTQFGILIMGYRNYLDKDNLEKNPIEELERLYVKSYEQSQADEEWLNRCKAELVKLQNGDKENLALWKRFIEVSLKEFDRIYQRLGVKFDMVRGESYYNDKLASVVAELEQKGLAEQSEGATVVKLDDLKLPLCIVRKGDGGFNYATTDLATVKTRDDEFRPERVVYVTDERQQLHFRQIFAISKKLGIKTRLEHIWFGLMRLPEGTFSTRQGNVIKLDRLLDEAESRALEVVRQTSPEKTAEQQKEIARAVGIGAVKYADLSQNPQTMITFSWDKALALDGNSAPYLQYAYARISSVRDKYKATYPGKDADAYPISIAEPIERKLAVQIARFPETVAKAAFNYRPNYIADYLYDLAQLYSNFYQNVPFIKADEGVRESRIRLCGMTARILRKGLELLGIETLERI